MDGRTLRAAMSYPGYPPPLTLARYTELVPPLEVALRQAHCTTVPRISMFLAQIGAESGSLRWSQELASGEAYNWRANLGNNQPGDGPRFKGRSFIQITGRAHYTRLSKWAHGLGYVPTSTYFVDHPDRLADDQYAFLGPVYYWTVARDMNGYADRHDIRGGTYAVNGGYNNLTGRTKRWNVCLALGDALLPVATIPVLPPAAAPTEETMRVVIVDPKDAKKHGVKNPGAFLDIGDMHPRHINTTDELHARVNVEKIPVSTFTIAQFRAIGGK